LAQHQTCESTVTDDTFEPDGDSAPPPGAAANDASAGAGRPTVGVEWQEGEPGHWIIKLSGLPGAPGEAVEIGRAGASNHSPAISDHASLKGAASRVSIAWIESPAGEASATGRVMWQSIGAGPAAAVAPPTAVNDNVTWVTHPGGDGVFGSEPGIVGLATGDTLVTWVGTDGHAHGRLYPPADASGGLETGDGWDAPEYATVNAALGDLGPVGPAPEGGRRLQAVELRPGALAVMWLALGESGPVLRGSLLLGPPDADRGDDAGGWTEHPIADARLPHGFAGQFALAPAVALGAALEVTYFGPAGTATVNVLDRIHIEGGLGREHGGEPGAPELAALPAAAHERDGAALYLAAESAARLRPEAGSHHEPAVSDAAHDKPAKTPLAIAADPGVSETAPLVQAVAEGFAVAWQAPAGTDNALQFTLRLYGQDGIAKGPAILVTSEAAADVAPAITGLGDGVAAAYVQAEDGCLVVKAYAGDGAQIGQDAVIDPGEANTIAEIALGSNAGDEIAVVYVERSDAGAYPGGYGNIMLQRYAVSTRYGESGLVDLGRDGAHDGADAPAQLTVAGDDPAAPQPAVGRAPSVAGVDDGELAIIWVEGDGARETIRGSVLDRGGGQILHIDLTDLLAGSGIANGTKPALLDVGGGDFLVSWLQAQGDDGPGYVVMSALYAETSPGAWLAPEHAISLKTFDSTPDDYSVAVSSDEAGLFLTVTWREDSSGREGSDRFYSQTYDIGGNRLGGATRIAPDDAAADAQAGADTVAAAGLPDGQIVVVYAEQKSGGDVDLAAQVFDVGTDDGAGERAQHAVDLGNVLAADNTFSTHIDEETAINPLANDLGAGLTIARINDVPISMATPVDVGSGWVQLREDGWLTVTPDAGYRGPIAFEYTVAGAKDGVAANGSVVVNVEASEAPAAVTLLNQVTAVTEDVAAAGDLKVADIALADGELGTDSLSLTGLDASMFKIVGSALYLKHGIELDFETKPTLSIEIQSSHGGGHDGAASFALNVASSGETLLPLAPDDTFDFEPAYAAHSGHEVIDLSDSAYATLQELIDSGALVQAGDDVVITLDPGDLTDPHNIVTLKGVDLSALSATDFKFS
jgi:hypothetical protein